MADGQQLFNYSVALDPSAEAVLHMTTRLRPVKIDPAMCRLPMGDAHPNIAIEDTIALAAGGANIGTELPPDQVL